MNRRRLLASALPFFFGTALRASAQNAPAPKAKPKRIRIEVSLLKPSLALGETNAQMIVLSTEEGIETNAMFLQTYIFHDSKADGPLAYQEYGPKFAVTAHLEAGGRIKLSGRIEFEQAAAMTAAANAPLPVNSTSMTLERTVTSGQAVTLGGVVIGENMQQVQVTATLL